MIDEFDLKDLDLGKDETPDEDLQIFDAMLKVVSQIFHRRVMEGPQEETEETKPEESLKPKKLKPEDKRPFFSLPILHGTNEKTSPSKAEPNQRTMLKKNS